MSFLQDYNKYIENIRSKLNYNYSYNDSHNIDTSNLKLNFSCKGLENFLVNHQIPLTSHLFEAILYINENFQNFDDVQINKNSIKTFEKIFSIKNLDIIDNMIKLILVKLIKSPYLFQISQMFDQNRWIINDFIVYTKINSDELEKLSYNNFLISQIIYVKRFIETELEDSIMDRCGICKYKLTYIKYYCENNNIDLEKLCLRYNIDYRRFSKPSYCNKLSGSLRIVNDILKN